MSLRKLLSALAAVPVGILQLTASFAALLAGIVAAVIGFALFVAALVAVGIVALAVLKVSIAIVF